jgi:hypothetical protein
MWRIRTAYCGTTNVAAERPSQSANSVKVSLTVGQVLRLLCIGSQGNLSVFDQFNPWRRHMTNEILTARFAQAILAVTATAASILVFQIAMLVG